MADDPMESEYSHAYAAARWLNSRQPTHAPAADSRAEAREQIARWLFENTARTPYTWDGKFDAISERHREEWRADADRLVLATPAVAEALAAREALRRVEALFAGGPDTVCRTTWRDPLGGRAAEVRTTECVEVPIEDLRRAFGDHP